MIPALAFLDQGQVIGAFEELIDHPNFPPEALPIANYFEDTYIGRMQRRGRQQPMFAIDFWNIHERTILGQARTNNNVEGLHY